jgi:hypothetical protein
MRILTNARLAGRNRRLAQYMFFASLGVPLLGLLLINVDMGSSAAIMVSTLLPFIVLPAAYIVMIVSIRMTNLWVREPRPEAALQVGLKGISNKSVLYNYIFMPVRHMLVTPQGVFSITTRFQEGSFSVNGSEWQSNRKGTARLMTLLRMDSIGNPTADALKAKAHIEGLLKDIAPGVTVQPIIVFTDPKVVFAAVDPTVPVLHAVNKDLPNVRDYLQAVTSEKLPTLTQEQIEAFERAYIPR